MFGLGIDGGGSATRWAVSDAAGAIVAHGEVGAISGHLYVEAERTRFHAAITAMAAALPVKVMHVVGGITGLSAGTTTAADATAILADALAIAPAAIRVEEDIFIAYHALFATGAGYIVYSGTGSIGYHLAADGSSLRVGGRGMLIDDAGSAFWIARRAIDHVWRARDSDPEFASPMARALDTEVGGAEWDHYRAHLYAGGRNAIAQLARAVAVADDADARAILAEAGRELARLAHALIARGGEKPVALLGRAATLHPLIESEFRAAAPNLQITLANPDAAAAAARLAVGAPAAQPHHSDQSAGGSP